MSDNIEWITEPAESDKPSEANIAVTLPSPPREFIGDDKQIEHVSHLPEQSLQIERVQEEDKASEPVKKPKDDRFVHYDFKPSIKRTTFNEFEKPGPPQAEGEPQTRTPTSNQELVKEPESSEGNHYSSDAGITLGALKPTKDDDVMSTYPNGSQYVVSDVEARAIRELRDEVPSRLSSLRINEPPLGGESSVPTKEKSPDSDAEELSRLRSQKVKDSNGFTYYTCRFCGITFNYITTLRSHERKHGVEKPFVCGKCGEAFHYECELQYHVKSHVDQKGYKCDCGRTFYQYTELLNHSHPDDPQPFYSQAANQPAEEEQIARVKPFSKIPESDFPTPEFAERGYEPKYQIRQYNEVRTHPYICQYCSKSYPDSRQLAYHMYSHRGERTFNPRASRYLMCRNENSYITPGVWLDR